MAHDTRAQADGRSATTSPAQPQAQPHSCGLCRAQGRKADTPCPAQTSQQLDHSRSAASQPYRATRQAQARAKVTPWAIDAPGMDEDTPGGYVAPYRCYSCKTPHATQLQADLCCPANPTLSADEAAGLRIGRFINRINGGL